MTRGPGRHSERNFRAAEQHYNAAEWPTLNISRRYWCRAYFVHRGSTLHKDNWKLFITYNLWAMQLQYHAQCIDFRANSISFSRPLAKSIAHFLANSDLHLSNHCTTGQLAISLGLQKHSCSPCFHKTSLAESCSIFCSGLPLYPWNEFKYSLTIHFLFLTQLSWQFIWMFSVNNRWIT